MRVSNIEYDITTRRYVVDIQHNGVEFYRFLDRQVLEDGDRFKDWFNTLFELAEKGNK